MNNNKLSINGNILDESTTKLYVKILQDRVKHPRKYDYVINVPGLADSKKILRDMGFKGKHLINLS